MKFQHKRRKPDHDLEKRRYQPSAVEDDRFDKMTRVAPEPPSYGAGKIIMGSNQSCADKSGLLCGFGFMKTCVMGAVFAGLATATAADGTRSPVSGKITTSLVNNGTACRLKPSRVA